jgi:hypothetical protein
MAVTYEPIATYTLGTAANSVTFSSIPGTYTDLRLTVNYTSATTSSSPMMRFNGDATALYSRTFFRSNGSTYASVNTQDDTRAYLMASDGVAAGVPLFATADIFSYANSTWKHYLAEGNVDKNGSGSVENLVGLWRSNSAITSILVLLDSSGLMAIGSTITLYGIKAA